MDFETVQKALLFSCGILSEIWQRWNIVIVFSPVVAMFVLPLIMVASFYGCVIFLHIYKHRRRQIYDAIRGSSFWDGALLSMAAFYDAQATFWNGYEMVGHENIPDVGPALLIYYHGALPLDIYYMMGRLLRVKKRKLRNVIADWLFVFPGLNLLFEALGCIPGPIDSCVDILKKGELLAISPGGVREALFSNHHYKMMWNNRLGFAKVAIKAQVPIIPVFTKNIRETYRSVKFGQGILRRLYEKLRLPIVLVYGGFPVKLTTYFGEPIQVTPTMKPEELALKVHNAIDELIVEHQQIPGSILRGLKERLDDIKSKKKAKSC